MFKRIILLIVVTLFSVSQAAAAPLDDVKKQ